MTLPLNKKQKQLVEKSMDLVPIMIRSMTRTAAYVTEEEQQELCQIEGYLSHPALWLRSALSGRNYWCKRVWQIFKEETLFTDGRYHSEAG